MSNAEDPLRQIQSQHAIATKTLQVVKTQILGREKDGKMLELTLRELEEQGEGRVFKSIGKMFMEEPYDRVTSELKSDIKAAKEDVVNLQKKQKYLEGEIGKANTAFREIIHQQQQAQARG
ncbi:hypothetical protein BT69DRAFT_1332402 [Atractiella rhizophila]|nr:hypothetical protein BT69DRAFT_1332402 [Atractiella rhizophila]